MEEKIYIKNERFMEFIDELATEFTQMRFTEETYERIKIYEGSYETHFTNEAQNYYHEKYDEIESMANNMILLYSDNELK